MLTINLNKYQERLSILNLKTLEERRLCIDLILLYKIIHQLIDIDFHEHFSFSTGRTRGHSYKLYVNRSRINCHKYHFFNRIVNMWNSLPSDVVLLAKLCNFKTKIYELDSSSFCIGRAFSLDIKLCTSLSCFNRIKPHCNILHILMF